MIALPEVEYLRLLGSEDGIKMLLNSGKELGIKIKAIKRKLFQNFPF